MCGNPAAQLRRFQPPSPFERFAVSDLCRARHIQQTGAAAKSRTVIGFIVQLFCQIKFSSSKISIEAIEEFMVVTFWVQDIFFETFLTLVAIFRWHSVMLAKGKWNCFLVCPNKYILGVTECFSS